MVKESDSLIPAERIEQSILLIRGQKVMLDADLAALYGVETFNLNKAVKRNIDRYSRDTPPWRSSHKSHASFAEPSAKHRANFNIAS
jgi:hypothetical protein